jgi:hypothetical protein
MIVKRRRKGDGWDMSLMYSLQAPASMTERTIGGIYATIRAAVRNKRARRRTARPIDASASAAGLGRRLDGGWSGLFRSILRSVVEFFPVVFSAGSRIFSDLFMIFRSIFFDRYL